MLKRSSIVVPEEELQDYYEEMRDYSLSPLWTRDPSLATPEPRSKALPYVWHWRDLRPRALRATELVGTEQAERRVLRLLNPNLFDRGATTNTLFAGIQIVMPGEIARAHRHTPAALRMIIEAEGGYTVVNGDLIPMLPGDLVLTPNWTWHDHANDSEAPMMWLDGLDAPLVAMLESTFREEYPEESQSTREAVDTSVAKYGAGALLPAWEAPTTAHSPLMHYPWSQVKPALERLAAAESGSPYDGVIIEYVNPTTAGPAMPTMGCYAQLLPTSEHTQAHRHTSSAVYHVVEGQGCTIVNGTRLEWETKDTFCVPGWATHEHINLSSSQPAFLFSYTDIPVLRSLQLYREQAQS